MAWNPGDILNLTGNVKKYSGFIKGLVREGLGANAIQAKMQSMGVGGNRQQTQQAVRAYQYAFRDPSTYLNPDSNNRPYPDLVPNAVETQSKTWRVNVGMDLWDNDLEMTVRKHITMDSFDLYSQDDYLNEAAQTELTYGGQDVDLVNSWIESINYEGNPIYSEI